LEDGRSKDDKMSRRMWKKVETKAEKVWVAETKGGREKETRGKETRREGTRERERKEN